MSKKSQKLIFREGIAKLPESLPQPTNKQEWWMKYFDEYQLY